MQGENKRKGGGFQFKEKRKTKKMHKRQNHFLLEVSLTLSYYGIETFII
jgi:hypothetical protein